jgi:hypothetical protein|tara:strand:- start:4062 stop:4235 length:174 start_codon:yes stop_codon:yes gene_type:complete
MPTTQNDPNFIYQQQLQHKSPGALANEAPEKQGAEPGTLQPHPAFQSPIPQGNANGI